ncbi:MAG TPA: SAM-dependent methyltransferase [Flavobacterium sp.]|nr:SAM-dependent methyltransferase [Flavobacterium sp.]
MNIKHLLSKEIQNFIHENLNQNLEILALKKNPFPSANYTEILNQISAKKKSKDKLPTWFNTTDIIFPSKISIEQTSSEVTAAYKSTLMNGTAIIDITGGFGVDAFYFAKKMKQVFHCEIDEELHHIVAHNFLVINQKNIQCFHGDGLAILSQLKLTFDWIYIDPSRRNDTKGKVFILNDCLPNVPLLLNTYFNYSKNILIKTAPLLDISTGIKELKFVKKIHIISIKNEVKELLWELEKNYQDEIKINAVSLENEKINNFETIYKKNYEVSYSLPKKYIYEPNGSIMKSGNVNALSSYHKIKKLHLHSHLFTSDDKMAFPGRCFELNEVVPFQKEFMKKLQNIKINCATRNFPMRVDEIKKKYKIKDGGTIFAFFTTNIYNEKIVLLCSKIDC